MSNPVFIVEGHMEQAFIQRICRSKKVNRLGVNGDHVSANAIAERIATQCRLLKGRYWPLIVIIDKENRQLTANEFLTQIQDALYSLSCKDQVILGIADQETENWIIANIDVLNNFYKKNINLNGSSDGFSGSNFIKSKFGPYKKLPTGIELLRRCNLDGLKNSPSFLSFFEKLEKLDNFECRWLFR